MEHSAEHLQQQLERVRHLSGAVGASAFLPSPWFGAAEPILLHAGTAAPVAELQDLAHARQFHGRHLESVGPEAATRDLRIVASETPGSVLLPVPTPGNLAALPPTGVTDSRRQNDRVPVALAGWLSLRFDDDGDPRADPGRFDLNQALGLAGSLARTFVTLYSFGNDPLTGLPGRAELHGMVREGLQHAMTLKLPFSVLFVNPDRFEGINDRFGRAAGDHVLREVVVRMQGALRAGDTVMRYGSAIFGLALPGTGLAHATAVAEKVRRALSSDRYPRRQRGAAVQCRPCDMATRRRRTERSGPARPARPRRPCSSQISWRRALARVDARIRRTIGAGRRSPRRGVHR